LKRSQEIRSTEIQEHTKDIKVNKNKENMRSSKGKSGKYGREVE
jgi:hypothetical protein